MIGLIRFDATEYAIYHARGLKFAGTDLVTLGLIAEHSKSRHLLQNTRQSLNLNLALSLRKFVPIIKLRFGMNEDDF